MKIMIMMPFNEFTLTITKGPAATQSIVFAQETVNIGSTYAQNDLIMNVKGISAQHARIWREKRKYFIQNICDTSIVIRDEIQLSKNETTELTSGTEIDLGEVGLRFIISAKGAVPTKRMIGIAGIGLGLFLVLIMAVYGVKKDKEINGGAKPYPTMSSEEPISLPAKGKYGYTQNNDKSHPDKAIFTFKTDSPNVEFYYTPGGIDTDKEVSIHLNGQPIGYAPLAKKGWGKETVLRLPKEFLAKGGENHLVFDNMENPPNFNQWAVKNIWIKALAENLCDVTKARKLLELGEEMYEEKTISKGNLYLAYRYYCEAVTNLQDCGKDSDVLRQAKLKKEQTMQEVDALYNDLKFAFKKAYEMKEYQKCRSILQNMVLRIPDESDERHKQAAEKLQEYNRYYEMRRK